MAGGVVSWEAYELFKVGENGRQYWDQREADCG